MLKQMGEMIKIALQKYDLGALGWRSWLII